MSNKPPVSIGGLYKILLVEDTEWMGETLINNLQKIDQNLQFAPVAENGRQALETLRASGSEVNLVIMDYKLGERSRWGVELTKDIVKEFPEMKIIFWSTHINKIDLINAKNAGAHGYMPKETTFKDVKDAIDRVMRGEEAWLTENSGKKPIEEELTPMEIKVLTLRASGKSDKQIATFLLEKEFNKKSIDDVAFKDKYKSINEYMDEVHIVTHKRRDGVKINLENSPKKDRGEKEDERVARLEQEFLDKTKNEKGFSAKYKTIDEYLDGDIEVKRTLFESRTKTVYGHFTNITKKTGKPIKEIIRGYFGLEEDRLLSGVEIEVLDLRREGKDPREIAEILQITEREVEDILNRPNLK